MQNRLNIGKNGEELAIKYLIKNGYKIISQNYRWKSYEIDVIAIDPDKTLVFVEVKALLQMPEYLERLTPEDNLTPWKLKKLSRGCQFFAAQNQNIIDDEKGWRIDLIAITL